MASLLTWTLSAVVLMAGHTLAQTHITNGDKGEVCGPDNRRCLYQEAYCFDNVIGICKCKSPKWDWGDGYKACYKNNTVRTEVSNDPMTSSYNNINTKLQIPCRYLLTHTLTHLKNKLRQKVGLCQLKTHAFHQKYLGKIYVSGYDFTLNISHLGTDKLMSIRMYGLAQNGEYKFYVNATDDAWLPDGDWGMDEVDYKIPSIGLKVEYQYVNDSNLAILHIKKCGIKIQFRSYDAGLKMDSPYVPHLSYSVNCAFKPEFLDKDKVVAIPPKSQNDDKTIDELGPTGWTRQQKILLRALNSGAEQNSPHPNPECKVAKDNLHNCADDDERQYALERCMFLMEVPRFIRCHDTSYSGVGITKLFAKCIKLYCGTETCVSVKALIESNDCHIKEQYDSIDDFLDNNCYV